MKKGILVVGSLNMDLVVRVRRHPQIGETLLGGQFANYPGGKGANQAVAAARLGAEVEMIGRVGTDAFGEILTQTLQDNGVGARWVKTTDAASTGVALITVGEGGDNTIVVASGANALLSPEDVRAAEQAFQNAQILLLQLESPLETVQCAVTLARQYGVTVILNPAPAQALEGNLLSQVDYLIPNLSELNLLAGSGEQDVPEACRALQAQGVKNVVVTLGSDGAFYLWQDGWEYIAPFEVTAVDTTAAGDAFVAAFGVALLNGMTPVEAGRWANAAGALTATRPGAQPSLPNRSELESFIDGG